MYVRCIITWSFNPNGCDSRDITHSISVMLTQLIKYTITAAATTLELLPNAAIPSYSGAGSSNNSGGIQPPPQLNLGLFMVMFIVCAMEVVFLKIVSALSVSSRVYVNNISRLQYHTVEASNASNEVPSWWRGILSYCLEFVIYLSVSKVQWKCVKGRWYKFLL